MVKLFFTLFFCYGTVVCVAQNNKFEYNLPKKGDIFSIRQLDNYKGKYLVVHVGKAMETDELLVIDIESKKRLLLPDFSGKPRSILLNEKTGLLHILTAHDYQKSVAGSMPTCFTYDLTNLSLKHTITGNYFHILAVDDKNIVLQEGKQLSFFSLQTGVKEKEYKLNIPDRYYGVQSSTLHQGKFICVIDSSQKKQQVYWEDINTGQNNLVALPDSFKTVSTDTLGSQIKWIAALKENQPYRQEKMFAWGIDINNGKIIHEYKSDLRINKLNVNQQDGRVILQTGSRNEMLTIKNGQVLGYPLDVDGNEFYWTPDYRNLVSTDYRKLSVYNLQMAQVDFSLESDIDGDMIEYEPISFIKGTNKILYADNSSDKNLKLGLVELRYPENINFSFPANLSEQMPSLMIQDGHRKAPTDIAFSAKNNRMISGDESGNITIWDAQSKMQIKKIQLQKGKDWGDEKGKLLLAVHPVHEVIAVSWQYSFIQFIDFNGREIFRLATKAQSDVVHFSEDGNYFYFEKENNKMAVFNLKESSIQTTYPFNTVGTNFNYAFNANSTKIALPLANQSIAILNAITGKGIDTLQTAHEKDIFAIAFHPSDSAVASLDEFMNVVVTDLFTRQSKKVLSSNKKMGTITMKDSVISMTPFITQILFNADGQLLIPGGMGSDVEGASMYNILAGDYVLGKNNFSNWDLYKNTASIGYFNKVALGDDKRSIWSVHQNNAIEVWDSKTREHLKTIGGNEETIIEINAAVNFNGFTTGHSSGTLRTWNFETSEFKNYNGVKFGNQLLHFNKDSTNYAHYFDEIIKVNLPRNEIISQTKHDYYSFWVAMTQYGAIVYDDKKLLLLDLHSKKKRTLYNFKEESSYYWSKERTRSFYCLDKEKENLFFYNPSEFKTLQLVQIQLATGKTSFHPLNLPGDEKEINSFDISNNNILITGKNDLYRYNLQTKAITKESALTQPAIFAESFYPALLKISRGGITAVYYQRSVAVENDKKEMLLDVFHENKVGIAPKNIPVKNKLIRSIDFSRDEKQLYICYEKEVEVWSLEEAKLLVTLAVLPQDKFILYTPDNYYFTSHKLTDIGFRVNEKIYDLSQFDLKYNRPDIVLKRLGYAGTDLTGLYEKAYRKRLSRLNITEEKLTYNTSTAPAISISNKKAIELLTTKSSVKINIEASTLSQQLNRLFIYINAVPVTGMNGQAITSGKTLNLEKELKLSNGANKISVYVTDENGVESLKENIEIVYKPDVPLKTTLYYAGIGVSFYADSSMNLTYADKDIRDLAKVIKAKAPDAVTITLLNNDATRENILALKQQLMKTNEEDIVILSLSGHGLVNKEGDFFYAGYETDFMSPEKTALSFEQLEWLLDSIPARKKLLLIDACHSGELDKTEGISISPVSKNISDSVSEKTNRGVILLSKQGKVGLQNSFYLMQELFSDLSKGNGTIVISAAAGTEVALETKELQNGLFTYCLINALNNKKADADQDKKIKVQELKNYLVEEVTRLSKGRQKPTTRKETIDNNWVIWE